MTDNNEAVKIITVTKDGKNFKVELHTGNIPMLLTALKLVDVNIEALMTRQIINDNPKIVQAPASVIDKLR